MDATSKAIINGFLFRMNLLRQYLVTSEACGDMVDGYSLTEGRTSNYLNVSPKTWFAFAFFQDNSLFRSIE